MGRGEARQALLDQTVRVVRRQGWAATSVDQLCRVAGVTKGAFFHHFASKEELGIAAAKHWSEITSPLFAGAPYHAFADPLDRLFGYLDFRAMLVDGPTEAFTCFAGTAVQEVFATSDGIRSACQNAIAAHVATLATDFQLAIERHPPREPVTADSLAFYTQTVLQGGFVVTKARGDRAPLLDAIAHLRRYLQLLFDQPSEERK